MENNGLHPDDLTPANINQIAFEIREQTAEPEDARRLLGKFCDLYDRNKAIPYELNMHLRDSFRVYLAGKQKVESALGLKRVMGRPQADPEMRTLMATDLLRFRFMEKMSHEAGFDRFVFGFSGDAR